MPQLSPNEKRLRANAFAEKWKNETREEAEAKSFWDGFFHIFGLDRYQVARYEYAVSRAGKSQGFIDVFWAGRLLCEHKSANKDLDRAEQQAMDYIKEIARTAPQDVPPYVIICDFARLRLISLQTEQRLEFPLTDLAAQISLGHFDFIDGIQHEFKAAEEQANIKAAYAIGDLYTALAQDCHDEHALKLLIIRLLFCFFADDTAIFEKNQFEQYLQKYSREDGSDLGEQLNAIFQVLNTPMHLRPARMNDDLKRFEYINGNLFAETLPTFYFDSQLRTQLLECSRQGWQFISPEIFGSLFQSVMDSQTRREHGAHYTEESHILNVINGLFLNDLRDEFNRLQAISHKSKRQKALGQFHQKISQLTFLDPACGCGNFLVVAYRELRALEDDLLAVRFADEPQTIGLLSTQIQCHLSQFHGIELDEFPAQIAKVAMWLTDHQCNQRTEDRFHQQARPSVPLTDSAEIINANALQIEWINADYIFGNPPFIGSTYQSKAQKAEQEALCKPLFKGYANLDYVANWYVKATQKMAEHPHIQTAFVSTNSITQGEQVALLWSYLLAQGLHIRFAYRTFQWTSSAKGKAAVHCVIIGLSRERPAQSVLFSPNARGEFEPKICKNINPYLIDAPNVIIQKRTKPISGEIEMQSGGKPTDGGYLLLSAEEMQNLVKNEPLAKKYIRPFLMGNEMINGIDRYCLWFADVPEVVLNQDMLKMPLVAERIENVRQMRLSSTKAATQKLAEVPYLFGEVRTSQTDYLGIPKVSSEARKYIPIGFLNEKTISGDKLFFIPNATLYHFGILHSSMHNAFMRLVAGRLKSDYSYSNTIVYNNFPFPFSFAERQENNASITKAVSAIEHAAQGILDARTFYRQQAQQENLPEPNLADFYHPKNLFRKLHQAHAALDKAVDAAYGYQSNHSDNERVAFLFERLGK